jgi:ketosteroid isomerase-like protein
VIAREELEALLREFYQARTSGNLAQLCDLFATNAVFEISGAAHAKPVAISATGIAEFRPWLALLLKTFRISDFAIHTLLIDGSKAAVRWRANIHSRITGSNVRTELIDLIDVEQNKVASYVEFFTGGGARARP